MKPILALYLFLGSLASCLVGAGLLCVFTGSADDGLWMLTIGCLLNLIQTGVIGGYLVSGMCSKDKPEQRPYQTE